MEFRSRYNPACLFLVLVLILAAETSGYAQRTKSSLRAGEQRKAERGLFDNRYYFYFINTSISNFGTPEEKNMFSRAIRHDLLAQLLYMRFQFHESYVEIRKSQKLMIEIYRNNLSHTIDGTKKLLDEFAPAVIHSADKRARSYLWLGYRDMKSASINMVMGDNYYEPLYSMRLYQYVKSIKLAKQGRRYALLSLIEVKTPYSEKKPFPNLSYENIQKKLIALDDKEKRDRYLMIHMDNYYKTGENKSVYDQVWENPELKSMEEYREYFLKPDF